MSPRDTPVECSDRRGERGGSRRWATWEDQPKIPGGLHGLLTVTEGQTHTELVFDDWTELETAYHRIFKKRRRKGTLRYARLKKNGVVVHSWDPEPKD
jgi:hypothetical protein